MTHLTDAQLLRDYASGGSQPAFAELVRRHVHLVHACALRQSRGDPHLADDITQAVFMVLARRARSIHDDASVTGWLVNTTRYAALSALKLESRRKFHERRATAMAQHSAAATVEDETIAHDALAGTLDAALARLRARDRSVIALRYLQGKGMREVGEALGISQQAAQKRVGRALERLRDVLARRGITTPADALAGNLSAMSLHVAPASLVSATIATGVAAAPAAASASVIATATGKAIALAKAKLFATAAAACIVVTGVAAPIILNSPAPSPTLAAASPPKPAPIPIVAPTQPPSPATTQAAAVGAPVKYANVSFFMNKSAEFTPGVDADTIRVPGGEPAVILTSSTPRWGINGLAGRSIDPAPFRGKRIRFSAYVKCKDLANWGSLFLIVIGEGGRILANDDMGGRPLTKTTDWTKLEIVSDIPDETQAIHCGLNLRGKGEIWMDSAQIEVVPTTVAITDDQVWHPWSFSSPHYSTRLDPTTVRNGKPTRLLESKVAGAGEWYAWDWNNRHPEKWLGKRMKLSMWIKTENVTGPSGLCLRVVGPNYQDIIPNLSKDQRNIRGTTPWTRYEFIAEIPPETQNICTGVRLGGKGKLWLDDVQYEMLD